MDNKGSIKIVTNVSCILGYKISHLGILGDIEQTRKFIASRRNGHYMACANPHSLVVASRDQRFRQALKDADLILPDGIGILIAARALKFPIKERVAGFEFFQGLSKSLAKNGGSRYFFLGSTDRVLNCIRQRINREYPEIVVCGTLSPPFKPEFSAEENATMVDAVNDARPDVLWVGMTAPKQEKWIYENRSKLKVPFTGAIGAVFDFYAGTKRRSSGFWQRIGLEWFPRFLREPRRLWERNMKSTPIFIYWIMKEKFKRQLNNSIDGR